VTPSDLPPDDDPPMINPILPPILEKILFLSAHGSKYVQYTEGPSRQGLSYLPCQTPENPVPKGGKETLSEFLPTDSSCLGPSSSPKFFREIFTLNWVPPSVPSSSTCFPSYPTSSIAPLLLLSNLPGCPGSCAEPFFLTSPFPHNWLKAGFFPCLPNSASLPFNFPFPIFSSVKRCPLLHLRSPWAGFVTRIPRFVRAFPFSFPIRVFFLLPPPNPFHDSLLSPPHLLLNPS